MFKKLFKKKEANFFDQYLVEGKELENCPVSKGLINWFISEGKVLDKKVGEMPILPGEKSLTTEDKILDAISNYLGYWFSEMCWSKGGEYADPTNEDFSVAHTAYAICKTMAVALFASVIKEGTVPKKELKDKAAKATFSLVTNYLPLHDDDAKKAIIGVGETLHSKMMNSDHQKLKDVVENISNISIYYILAPSLNSDGSIHQKKLHDALLSTFDNLHGSLEYS